MQLEDYFEFEKFDRGDSIVLKGTRIDIEHLLDQYIAGESPERIHQQFRRYLSLEQVYATITFYLHNRQEIDDYLERGRVLAEQLYQEHLKKDPPEVVKRLQALTDGCYKLNEAPGGTKADGKIAVEFAECIGACEGAPAVLINDEARMNLTPEKVDGLLAELRQ